MKRTYPKNRRKRGTGCIHKRDGYIIVPNPRGGQTVQHRLIMEEYLKRPLNDYETIHHKNGIRTDNRIENLELWVKTHPAGSRIEDKIEWCKEFLRIHDTQHIERNIQ